MYWVLESNVFPRSHAELRKAIAAQEHRIVEIRPPFDCDSNGRYSTVRRTEIDR